jgi:DNA-directed RNA polymerase subunit M/transcription elongation factor TFIIS
LRATEDQVGQELTCPDCDTAVIIPRPPEVEQKPSPPAAPVEEYALCEEVDESAVGRRLADLVYVPVTCPTCSTFMKVPEDQVGHEIECPDCRQPMVVPPPVEKGRRTSGPAADLGEYELHEEEEAPGHDAAMAAQARFPLLCPQCGTLMHPWRDQVGQRIVCRDCESAFVVPRPAPAKHKPDLQAQAGDVYGVHDSIEAPQYKPSVLTPRGRSGPGAESATDRDREAAAVRTRPPRWTFFSGIFGFPAYRNSWPRWLGLSLGAIPPILLITNALALVSVGPGKAMFLGMVLGGLGFCLGMVWAVVAFASCLSILRDTADGYHQIENWPEALFLDWIGEFFFLIYGLTLSVLPGLAVGAALASTGVPRWLSVSVSLVLLFPVILLAMLETNSPLNPISLPVWRSLLSRWWAWGLFYIETAVLLAIVGGLTFLATAYLIAPAAPLLVAALMIYFRLLGRLAWHCAEGAPPHKPPPADNQH